MGAGANRPSAQGRCGANHTSAQGRCGANHPSCKPEILGNSGCKNGQARVYCPSSLPKFSAQLAAAQPVVWPAAGSVSLTDSTRCPTSSSKIPHVQAKILQNFSQVSNTFLLVRIASAGGLGRRSYPRPATPRTTRAMPARSAILSDVSDARQSGLIQSPRILMYNRSSWRRSKLQP